MFKLLMTWDIQPGREKPYDEFMVNNFIPTLTSLGLEPSEVWYSLWGAGPQIMVGCAIDDKDRLSAILKSERWTALQHKLIAFVVNYRHKVVNDNGYYFQL